MQKVVKYNDDKKINIYTKVTISILFLIGFLNSKPYIDFMGYSSFSQSLLFIFFIITILMTFITIINMAFKRDEIKLSSKYWVILAIALVIKYIFLFIQFPSTFLPGRPNFYPALTMFMTILLIFIVTENIKSIQSLRLGMWALGIGVFISTLIPIVLFPEFIGTRISDINGFKISGGFWNQSVISFISAGFILFFLFVYEKNRLLKTSAFLMFITLILGGVFGLSRALLLSVTASIFIYLIISNNIRKYLKGILIVSVLIIISSYMFSDVIEQITTRIDGGINIEEEARVDIWSDYIKNVPDYFFFGEIEGDYKKYSSSAKKFGPHSVLLNWFVQYGILALIGFIYLMFGIYKSAKKIYRYQGKEFGAVAFAWLVAYLSVAIINETGFDQLTIFAGIGIMLSWGSIVKSEKTIR